MGPSHTGPLGSHSGDQRQTWSQNPSMMTSNNRRARNEDSWIEISSQPSSSSLSSVNQAPVAFQIQTSDERASRRTQVDAEPASEPARSASATGSSQDEYEESSSESDPTLSSSNEEIAREEYEEDDRTALRMRPTETVFTPPENAFSHPPPDRQMSETYFTHANSTPSSAIRTDRYQRTRPNLQRERTSGSFQPDHDAALRASLTTLLSCAAAVKPKEQRASERPVMRPAAEHTAFQLVPESHLQRQRSPKAVKRRSRESSKERHAKKLKAVKTGSNEETISPTLTVWMISAGVVLVFSAISFSAGYAWGKEVGRLEGEMGLTGGSCGQEAMRGGSGLRKMRWSAGNSSIRA